MAFIPSAGKATTPSPPTGDESQKPLSEPTHAVTGVSTPLTSATHTRNETMMEALFELQVGNIDSAITLVANAFSLFDCDLSCSNHGGGEPSLLSHEGMCEYLPGLLFLVCLRCVINDHFSLHRRIPPCLSLVFSRAISSTPEEMRAHCMRVLSDTSRTSEQEWTDLVSTASLRGNVDQHHQQESAATSSWSEEQSWSFKFFVALWKLYCSPSSSYHHQISSAQIFEMSGATNLPPPPQASPPSCAENNTLRMIPWRAASVTFLGFCYFFGVGGADKDIHKAVTLYQLAADAGHADAMCKLGARYASGTGVDKDVHKAVSLHQRAADAGDTMATFFLGVCYINGEGVTKDAGKAVLLWLRASVAGNVKAMQYLGVCYANGDGFDKDIHKAVSLWNRAADAGDANAMLNLGTCYCHGDGSDGFSKDIHEAMRLWLWAAALGHPEAVVQLRILQAKSNT
ncbi:calmodulin-dependent protein kinase [Pelomyxa schiedti]|nr:calmodulin-dependent protein kinase [Pelomyxa schiedti]